MQILRTVPGEYQILDKCFLSLLLALETVAAPPPPPAVLKPFPN